METKINQATNYILYKCVLHLVDNKMSKTYEDEERKKNRRETETHLFALVNLIRIKTTQKKINEEIKIRVYF